MQSRCRWMINLLMKDYHNILVSSIIYSYYYFSFYRKAWFQNLWRIININVSCRKLCHKLICCCGFNRSVRSFTRGQKTHDARGQKYNSQKETAVKPVNQFLYYSLSLQLFCLSPIYFVLIFIFHCIHFIIFLYTACNNKTSDKHSLFVYIVVSVWFD